MSSKEIRNQLDFLTNLLELPPSHRTVSTLSGGQQRRVSFAISLIHDPELIILDEPTVGVDPMLRQSIWNHLLHLSKVNLKTVIITTHYIEEAKQAGRVGFMRAGRLLAEDKPCTLLLHYGVNTLEDVFLRLCMADKEGKEDDVKSKQIPLVQYEIPDLNSKTESKDCSSCMSCGPSMMNLWALLIKNVLKLRRNLPMLLFIFLLPAIQVLFFCVAIGQEPTGLKLGVVNNELIKSGLDECSEVKENCSYSNLGCRLFSQAKDTVELIEYEALEKGLADVGEGAIWGIVTITSNFSEVFIKRLIDPNTVMTNSLSVRLDMSNQQIALTLQKWILESVSNFTTTILEDCGHSSGVSVEPVEFEKPLFGERDPSFTEFMAPGIIILIIYFLAVALTGEAFIMERSSGLLDRSWIAGVKPSEILASHILVQFFVMMIQTAVTLTTILIVFGIPCRGPLEWLAVITMLQGLAGMSFGFLISSLCDTQAIAMQLSIGSFYPCLLLSGILWPLEGMPSYLQAVAKFLPNTLACQAMRDIMLRGWDIAQQEVYLGVISSSIWILIFLVLSWMVVKLKT